MNESHRSAIRDHGDTYIIGADELCRAPLDAFPDTCGPRGGGRLLLEIGFGMGHATATLAGTWSRDAIVGVEVYPPGVGRLIAELRERNLCNVRIIRADAVDVLEAWNQETPVDGTHVFFPDPWPKKRHHKRRLVQLSFLQSVYERSRAGSYLYLVTDWADYAYHMRDVVTESGLFTVEDPDEEGFSRPRDWRPTTAFEMKGLAKGHRVRELFLRRQ